MKNLKRVVSLLLLSFAGSAVLHAQIKTVGTTKSSHLNGSSKWSVNVFPAAGDTLLVGCDFDAGISFTGVADKAGDTFTQIGTGAQSTEFASRAYIATNVKGGSTTVTCTAASAPQYNEIYVTELSGVDPIHPLDTQVAISGPQSPARVALTTANANELVWAYIQSGQVSNASGWTALSTFDGNLIADRTQAQAGVVSASFPVTTDWTLIIAALNPAGSSPAQQTPPSIVVTVSPATANVQVNQSSSFTATLQNDSQSKGVTWSLSGSGCSGATCGTLANVTATSATYIAPASVPSPATVTLAATSVTDATKSASAIITVTAAPISVAVSPSSASVQVNQSTPMTATLQNDTRSQGVTWSLSGSGCSGATCGSLTNVTTTSATYNAPSSVPKPATVTLTATSVADTTKSSKATITVTAAPVISVAVSPSTASVQVNQSTPLTATLQNDTQGKGVTWSLSGSGCSGATCGSLTNTTTTSVTYNAPAYVPAPATVTLTATSVADTTKSAKATITVTAPAAISVAVTPATATVPTSQSVSITATIQNDTQSQGVTWSLSGSGCSGATCGSLTNVTTSAVTYNAPASVPSPATVVLTAVSVADATKSASANVTVTVPSASAVPALVQHVSHSATQTHFVNSYLMRLTLPTGSGNCVLVAVQSSTSGSVPTVIDDQGNAYTQVVKASDSNNNYITLFKAPVTQPGSQSLQVNFSTAAEYVAAEASEFTNVDPACTVDGTASSNSGTGSSLTAGTISTTTSGDLIYAFGIQDTTTSPITSWTAGSGFALLGADVMDSHFTEWQVQNTAGAINASATLAPSNHWFIAAMAIKAGNSGTAPSGIHGVHNLHVALPAGQSYPLTVQFPCTTATGPIVVIGNAEPSHDFLSLSDSNGNTWTKRGAASTAYSGIADIWDTDAAATTCTTNMTVTINKSGTDIIGSTLIFIDLAGAIPYPAFDATPGYASAGGTQTVSGNIVGASITPTTANGACFASLAVDANSIIGVSAPALFLSSTANPEPPDFQDDENNGYAVIYNPGTAGFTLTWQETAAAQGWANGITCYRASSSGQQQSAGTGTSGTTSPSPAISNIASGSIAQTTATITWTTNVATSSQVNYGTTTAYSAQSPVNSSLVTNHSVALSGLNPSTLYHYQVVSTDASSNQVSSADFTFTTTAASGSGSGSGSLPALVQYTNDSYQNNSAIHSWRKSLPNPTQAGNLLVLACTWGSSSSVANVSDDQGNVWSAGPAMQDSAMNRTLEIFYANNVAAATQVITMNLSSAAAYVQCTPHEFYNVSTSANPTDGASAAITTSGTKLAAGNLTTSTPGDLIFYAGVCDTCGTGGKPLTWTAGTGFNATVADGTSFFGAQYEVQSSSATINPAMTLGSATSGGLAAAVAFKSATAGSAAPAGIHVNSAQVITYPLSENWSGTSITLQIPTTGNLLVIATESLTSANVTSISSNPANVWQKTGNCANNDANAMSVCIWYAANATSSTNMTITLNYNEFPVVGPIDGFWDISGAAAAPFDVAAIATGNLGSATGAVPAPTLTPSTANGLIIGLIEQDGQTVGSASPGALLTVQSDGYQYLGMDQDGGWLNYYNPNTTPVTIKWAYVNTEGSYAAGNWEAIAAAFKAAH